MHVFIIDEISFMRNNNYRKFADNNYFLGEVQHTKLSIYTVNLTLARIEISLIVSHTDIYERLHTVYSSQISLFAVQIYRSPSVRHGLALNVLLGLNDLAHYSPITYRY
jgi:hypothetical protein